METIKWNKETKSFGISEDKLAFLMVYYRMPQFIIDTQSLIDNDLLYSKPGYGFEFESHVTLGACLDNDLQLTKLKGLLKSIEDYSATIINISKFTKEEYDVIKCDILSDNLVESNQLINSNFVSHSKYTEYNPHMTVAYVKPGTCDYLLRKLNNPINLTPVGFVFSYYDGDENKKITWR